MTTVVTSLPDSSPTSPNALGEIDSLGTLPYTYLSRGPLQQTNNASATVAALVNGSRPIRRIRTLSGGESPLEDTSFKARPVRDATQPRSGSIGSVRSESPTGAADDVDEDDVTPLPRARSQTCPDVINRRRKSRVKSTNRPPTPPPSDAGRLFASQEVVRVKVKLRLSEVDLSRVAENTVDEMEETATAAATCLNDHRL